MNISPETMFSHIRSAMGRGLRQFSVRPAHDRDIHIACSGPSLAFTFREIRGTTIACNNAHDFLIANGVIPDFAVCVDGQQGCAGFYKRPHNAVTYLIASQCHPDVFDALWGQDVVMWHSHADGVQDYLEENAKDWVLVGGGSTVGLRALSLAYLMGYRDFHFYGLDSCYLGEHHAAPQGLNMDDVRDIEVTKVGDRTFMTAAWMRAQADYFVETRKKMYGDCTFTIHGDGYIAALNEHC